MGHSVETTSLHHLFFFSFHMPIFFIISGFLFAHSDSVTLCFREIAYKRFRSLFLPYFTTMLIVFLARCFIIFYSVATSFYSINHDLIYSITHGIDYTYQIMLQSGLQMLLNLCYGTGKEVIQLYSVIYPIGALWFLPSLFSAIIIFYFFLKLFEKYSIAIQSIIIILLTFAGYMIGKHIFLPWSIDISLVSQTFMFSGYLMRKYMIFEKKTTIWLFVAVAGIWLLDLYMGGIDMSEREYNNLAVSTIGAIAASYLLMKLSYSLSNRTSFYYKAISYIGSQSLVIFCFHMFDIWIFPPMINYSGRLWIYQNNYWMILAGFRLCYSLLITETIKLLPVVKSAYYPKMSRIIKEQ